jgi:hypothetical protein
MTMSVGLIIKVKEEVASAKKLANNLFNERGSYCRITFMRAYGMCLHTKQVVKYRISDFSM